MIITIHNGEIRGIVENHTDTPGLCQDLEAYPQRASDVLAVTSGPKAGWWYVDFSPLVELTGDVEFGCCLVECFRTRQAAIEAEVQWLKRNFLGLQDGEI